MKPEASQQEQDPPQLSGGRGEVGRRGEFGKGAAGREAHMLQPKLLGATWTKASAASSRTFGPSLGWEAIAQALNWGCSIGS